MVEGAHVPVACASGAAVEFAPGAERCRQSAIGSTWKK